MTVTLIRHWKVVSREQKLFFAVILIGQLSNAVICGALSGPHERYQARLGWLFPFAAVVLHYDMANKRRQLEESVFVRQGARKSWAASLGVNQSVEDNRLSDALVTGLLAGGGFLSLTWTAFLVWMAAAFF